MTHLVQLKNKKYESDVVVERNKSFLYKDKENCTEFNFYCSFFFFHISISSNINLITKHQHHHLNHQPSQLYNHQYGKQKIASQKNTNAGPTSICIFSVLFMVSNPHIKNIIKTQKPI